MDTVEDWEIVEPDFIGDADISSLLARGFVWSPDRDALYMPAHWEADTLAFDDGDIGEYWVFDDCFRPISSEARAWLDRITDDD